MPNVIILLKLDRRRTKSTKHFSEEKKNENENENENEPQLINQIRLSGVPKPRGENIYSTRSVQSSMNYPLREFRVGRPRDEELKGKERGN